MPDERNPQSDELLENVSVEGAVVPPLFRIEVGNALIMGVRRRRIAPEYIGQAIDVIEGLPLRLDLQGAERIWTSCIDIAGAHGLSLYDAVYLELASRLAIPLATFDAKLALASRRIGVTSLWPDA